MNTKIACFIVALVLAAMACAWMPIPSLPIPSLPMPPTLTSEEKDPSTASTVTSGLSGTRADTPEAVTRAYYNAWRDLDADRMTPLISDFSLDHAGITRDSARAELKKYFFDGWVVEDYEVLETRMLDSITALVRIVVKGRQAASERSTSDWWIALKLESREWRLSWNGLVNVMPLATPAQTINGLEIQPVELQRFTDHLTVVLSIHNRNTQKILWGLNNDVVLTAFFPDRDARDLQAAYSIEPNREFLADSCKFDGFFEVYPEALRLTNFMATNQWGVPLLDAARWSYDFSLVPAAVPSTNGS